MNQRTAILNHLTSGQSITPLEAMGVFKVFRLAARIEELRRDGYDIVTERKKDSAGRKYYSYRLVAQ